MSLQIGPVKEYVKMLCDNQGLKFIVFAYHHVMMDGIAEQLHDEGVQYMRIDGSTPPQDRPVSVSYLLHFRSLVITYMIIPA